MRWVCLAVFVLPLFLACGGTETTEPVNQAPSIEFTFADMVVDRLFTHDLSVAVNDPEGDPLTVVWTVTSGSLTAQNSDNTIMRWDPPDTPGCDTVTVSVSDGEFTESVTEQIKRGTTVRLGSSMGSRTFSKADSPYIVKPLPGIVTPSIGPGQTFTLQAGVEWYITRDDDAGLRGTPTLAVEGALVATGTDVEPVVIRPNNRFLRCVDGRGWWGGIDLVPDGVVTLDYTEISYGVYNVRISQSPGTATLRNSRFLCSSIAGISLESNGSLVVEECRVTDNGNHGVEINSLVSLPANVSITNSEIRFNGHTGIFLDLNDVGQDVPITISGNLIEFNASNGIAMTHAVWPSIHNNDISKNNTGTLSNIRLLAPFPEGVLAPAAWDTLLATHNYWGGVFDPGEDSFIEQGVWDSRDIPSLGTRVIINPWENDSQHTP
jgi:hypothetical protein